MPDSNKKNMILSVLSVLGLFAIIAIGVWGAVNAFRLAPSTFSGLSSPLSSKSGKDLKIRIDTISPESGIPTTISWEHKSKNTGLYAFSYRCRQGFRFETSKSDGSYSPIQCETPYNIPSSEKSLKVIPVSKTNRFIDVPFVITYSDKNGKIIANDENMFTVVNKNYSGNSNILTQNTNNNNQISGTPNTFGRNQINNTANTTQNNHTNVVNTNTHSTTIPAPKPNPIPRIPDLKVRILDTGIMQNGIFIPHGHISENSIVAVKFEVKNIGNGASGAWKFTSNLPTTAPYTFNSKTQSSLGPQDRIEFTLQFNQFSRSNTMFSVQVDPNNQVRERNEANNYTSRNITIY